MSWQSTVEAHAYWSAHCCYQEPPAALGDAEIFLLSRKPSCLRDVACIIDVLCANGGDNRVDGLDTAALYRVREFLSRHRERSF